jgi:hypothetical protein
VTEIVDTQIACIRKPRTSSREEASELIVFVPKQQIYSYFPSLVLRFINRRRKVDWMALYLYRSTVHFLPTRFLSTCSICVMSVDTEIAI